MGHRCRMQGGIQATATDGDLVIQPVANIFTTIVWKSVSSISRKKPVCRANTSSDVMRVTGQCVHWKRTLLSDTRRLFMRKITSVVNIKHVFSRTQLCARSHAAGNSRSIPEVDNGFDKDIRAIHSTRLPRWDRACYCQCFHAGMCPLVIQLSVLNCAEGAGGLEGFNSQPPTNPALVLPNSINILSHSEHTKLAFTALE